MNQNHTPSTAPDHSAELPKVKAPFDAGVEIYFTPRMEGEANLIAEVRGIFLEKGIKEEALAATYDANRHIQAAQNKNTVVQRVHVNRFLNSKLVRARIPTVDLRAELLPNGSVDNWLKVVGNKVAPFIAQNNLMVS